MEELIIEVCSYALNMQNDAELKAIDGLTGASAIIALANSYRLFAKEHKELYVLIMNTAASCGDKLSDVSDCITQPFFKVLESYSLSKTEKIHWQRILRGIIHGFVSQEYSGFFSHFRADTNESFEIAVNCYICGLQNAERGYM